MQGRRGQPSRLPASRLPAIAPRDEQPSSSQAQQGPSLAGSRATDLPKTRLPPRSRNGCWTCRQRKVKCDEAKPECNQCTRLGHTCDYSSKVAFKDETRKVVDKYVGSSRPESQRWDVSGAELDVEEGSHSSADEDVLPTFTALTNDEDWQKKAGHQPPGTYFVVANPASFQHLEEYNRGRDDQGRRPSTVVSDREQASQRLERVQSTDRPATTRLGSTRQTLPNLDSEERNPARTNIAVDPETIVLGTFEEDSQRTPHWNLVSPLSITPGGSIPAPGPSPALAAFTRSLDNLSMSALQSGRGRQISDSAAPRVSTHQLLNHYRTFVRRHIVQIHRGSAINSASGAGQNMDLFEQEAVNFPPLFNALMALSALSLTSNDVSQNVDALEYSQLALGPLLNSPRTDQDLASNGTILTHFILLLYEISAAESMWPTHLATLNRVAQIRRNVYGKEPFPAILWWVCIIDIHALLGGSGQGSFIGNMINSGQVPTAAELLQTPDLLEPSGRMSEELETISSALEFHQTISLLAAELGFLAKELRELAATRDFDDRSRMAADRTGHWHQRAEEIRDKLKQAWRMKLPRGLAAGYRDRALPTRIRGIFEHTYLMHRTCIIYSHTSMWSTQLIDSSMGYENEVAQCASDILVVASETVRRREYEHGFIMFPLFLAGVATSSASNKMQAHEFMLTMEGEGIGNNRRAVRKLLEAVYERQNNRQMEVGGSLDVDWIQVMKESGLQVVNFGS